jgi:hypothetical protein
MKLILKRKCGERKLRGSLLMCEVRKRRLTRPTFGTTFSAIGKKARELKRPYRFGIPYCGLARCWRGLKPDVSFETHNVAVQSA